MELQNHKPKPAAPVSLQSGGGQVKTLEEFKQLAAAEYQLGYDNLLVEFRGRKDQLVERCESVVKEYEFINELVQLNTIDENNSVNETLMSSIEMKLAGLDYEAANKSFALAYWKKEYGENMILQVTSDILFFFLKQFKIKHMMSGLDCMKLAAKLLAGHPGLKIKELVFAMNKGLTGGYGSTYQTVDVETVMTWLSKFYEASAAYFECQHVNFKPESSNASTGRSEEEKFIDQQKMKKRVCDRIWVAAKTDREKKVEIDEIRRKASEFEQSIKAK